MSAATVTLHPDEKVKAGKLSKSLFNAGMGIFVLFAVLSIVFGKTQNDHWKRFFYAYLIGWSWAASISIGALFFVILHHLTRSRWSVVVRRIAECITNAFPLIAIAGLGFLIPLLAGYGDLYYWAHPDGRNPVLNHHMAHKLSWLDPTFFAIRYVAYFVIYTALSRYFAKLSRQQDESGDPQLSERLRWASGPGIIAFSLTTVLFAFDLIMSIAPKWYSTIFGVNFFGGANLAFFAFTILLILGLQRRDRLVHSVTTEHYHDMGKWLFAWTFFWCYTAFSQFMLIWYGNIPEETVFYKYRMFGEWQWVSIAVLVGHFGFPFLFLLSRWTKRIMPALVFFAVWQLVFHWVDLYWNVMPNYEWQTTLHEGKAFVAGPLMGNPESYHVNFSAVDITAFLAMVGIFVAAVGRSLTGNLIPIKDPRLAQSLGFENY